MQMACYKMAGLGDKRRRYVCMYTVIHANKRIIITVAENRCSFVPLMLLHNEPLIAGVDPVLSLSGRVLQTVGVI